MQRDLRGAGRPRRAEGDGHGGGVDRATAPRPLARRSGSAPGRARGTPGRAASGASTSARSRRGGGSARPPRRGASRRGTARWIGPVRELPATVAPGSTPAATNPPATAATRSSSASSPPARRRGVSALHGPSGRPSPANGCSKVAGTSRLGVSTPVLVSQAWTCAFTAEDEAFAAEVRAWLARQPRLAARRSVRSTRRSRGAGRGRPSWPPVAGSAIHWPGQYGGRGASPVHVAIFNTEYGGPAPRSP